MNPAAELFYCPYCAEQDLYPADDRDTWRCTTCRRTFSVALISIGHLRPLPDPGGSAI
jgi:transposase-like protein